MKIIVVLYVENFRRSQIISAIEKMLHITIINIIVVAHEFDIKQLFYYLFSMILRSKESFFFRNCETLLIDGEDIIILKYDRDCAF